MAAFYLDHNTPQKAVFYLGHRGYFAVTSREQHRTRASDAEQLRVAARNRWTLIPDLWLADRAASELDQFVESGLARTNRLYLYRSVRGWERYPVP